MQFPKELRRELVLVQVETLAASMKCSSRRNCDQQRATDHQRVGPASMKCSSRRNCDGPLSIARHQEAYSQHPSKVL